MNLARTLAAAAAGLLIAATAASAETLKTGVDGTFAPHAMPKLGGGVEGFNVDYAYEIGKRLGVEIDLTAAQWSGLLPGLQAGTYDFIAAPTTLTKERAENLLFIEGYLNTDFQFVVKKGAESVTALDGFKGNRLNFRPWNNQLRQPILLVTHNWVVERAPMKGFLHQTNNMDTLGFNETNSGCRF